MPEKNEYQGKGAQGSDPAKIRNLEAELAKCAAEMEKMQQQVTCLLRDQGLEIAIGQATDRMAKIFAPLQAFAPTRDFSDGQRAHIEMLRLSLSRADFGALDFGPVIAGANSSKKGAAA